MIGLAAGQVLAEPSRTVIGGEVGNGNFNADASPDDARLFQHTEHWHNLSGSKAGPTATKHNPVEAALFQGDGTRHAMLLRGPVFINDAAHIVSAAGEVFQISLDFCDAIPKWIDNTDAIEVFFFTCDSPVDGNTQANDIREFASVAFSTIVKDGKFESYSNRAAYTTEAEDVGKQVYVGLRAKTDVGIARVDNVVFTVAGLSGTESPPLANGPFGDVLKESPGDWQLVVSHSDEFDGDAIDRNKWNIDPEDWGVWSWEPDNVRQEDGKLHLQILPKTHKRSDQELYYVSGMAKNDQTITYGYFEARVKGCSRYPGACPAFWLYSRGLLNRYQARDSETVSYTEIDIIELQQSEYDFETKQHFPVNHIDCNLHAVLLRDGKQHWVRPHSDPEMCKTSYDAPWDPRDDFHIYAVLNTPEEIVWYIDGQKVGRKPNLYWHLPMHVTLSLGLRYPFSAYKNNVMVPVPEQTTAEGFPTTMSVDFVRVWQRPSDAATTTTTASTDWTRAEYIAREKVNWEQNGWTWDQNKVESNFREIDANKDGVASGKERQDWYAKKSAR